MARRPAMRSRGREDWRGIVEALSRSGLSVAQYARRHGLSASTLAWWRWALRVRPADPAPAARRRPGHAQRAEPRLSFVPVSVVADEATRDDGGALHVVLADGRRVDVRAGFDSATLTRLVQVLESMPC